MVRYPFRDSDGSPPSQPGLLSAYFRVRRYNSAAPIQNNRLAPMGLPSPVEAHIYAWRNLSAIASRYRLQERRRCHGLRHEGGGHSSKPHKTGADAAYPYLRPEGKLFV